ncbi:MAG: HigA family addiction module antitoxin [Bryobacteraceae bacterium]
MPAIGADVRRMRRPPSHPGEVISAEFLEPMGMTQAQAAAKMGITANRLNEIVKGKRGVSADTAWKLAGLFGTSPGLWMNLQSNWDLWHAAPARRSA